jgi:transposase
MKAAQLKRHGQSLRFSGKTFRVFERHRLDGITWRSGCFAQDSVGDRWLCLPVEWARTEIPAPLQAVGIDLGLKNTAATSDGRLAKTRMARSILDAGWGMTATA